MKSVINYYYNFFPNHITQQENFCFFWYTNNKYYFVPFVNNEEEVLKIYKLLINKNVKVNKIIFNKDGKLITKYNKNNYVLIMIDCIENEKVELTDFYNIKLDSTPINWGEIWSAKIDYLEYQVNQRALGKDNILNSFSYFVGLGENAIQCYNLIDKSEITTSIQHKRVYDINYEINYYNPLNMIIDYSIRDIAEYIKFSFFKNNLNINFVINYINKLNLNETMINLLYIRLLFPSYYFDCYEKFINNEATDKNLIDIINKTEDYEKFLKNFYLYYRKKYNLIKLDWI